MKCLVLVVIVIVLGLGVNGELSRDDQINAKPMEQSDRYWRRLPNELQEFRQVAPSRRITFGHVADRCQFPYQALIYPVFSDGRYICGATVLSEMYLLTAAHCVDEGNLTPVNHGQAGLGVHDRLGSDPQYQWIGFDSDGIRIHPQYDESKLQNDVATIRLSNIARLDWCVQPVKLPAVGESNQFRDYEGTVSSFGVTEASPYPTSILRYTRNPILSAVSCFIEWYPLVVNEVHICLSNDGGRSSCGGDSGGPLTVRDGDSSMQVGIVSFGSTAGCSVGMPSVYTRVTTFVEWILQNSDYRH